MEAPNIHDITAPGEFLPEPTTPWWVWALVATGVIAATILVILRLRHPHPNKQRANLLEETYARLAKLKKESPTLALEEIATKASLIIRRYLEIAFHDPALFETNEEFTLRPHALEKIHPDCREPITSYLTNLSQLKYAPSQSDRPQAIIDGAEDLLAQLELHVMPVKR